MRKFVLSAIVFGAVLLSPVALELTGTSVQVAVGTAQAQDTGTVTGCAKPACSLAEKIADEKGFVYNGWKVTRSVVNIILILGLLVISFSNITRISIDTYTIKKALPNLLIGIVLANASLFIIRYIADLATVVTYFFVELSAKLNSQVISGSLALENYTFKTFIADVTAKIGLETIINSTSFLGPGGTNLALIFMLLIGLIIVIGLLWLAALLYVRLAYVYLLTILAPIAFVAYGVPGMAKYFTQWWQMFTKWVFMLPAMAAVFWLMLTVAGSGQSMSTIQLILMYILFFTALTIPTKWGGAVMGKVSSGFQKYTGLEAGKKWAGDTAKNYGNLAIAKSPVGRIQKWAELNKANMEARIKEQQTLRAEEARRGVSGRVEAQLARRAGISEDRLNARKDRNDRLALTKRLSEELELASIDKSTAEKEKQWNQSQLRFRMLEDRKKPENTHVKEAVDNFARANSEADAITEALSTAEKIIIGDYTNPRHAALAYASSINSLRALKRQDIDDLKKIKNDPNLGPNSQEYADKLAEYQTNEAERNTHLAELETRFDSVKDQFEDLKGMSATQLALRMKNKNDTDGKIWTAEQKKQAAAYEKGIEAQTEAARKTGDVVQVHNDYMKDYLKLDPKTIKALAKGITTGVDEGKQRDFDLYVTTMKDYMKSNRNPNYNGGIQGSIMTIAKHGDSSITYYGQDANGNWGNQTIDASNADDFKNRVDSMDQKEKANLVKAINSHASFAGGPSSHVGSVAGMKGGEIQ